MIETRVEAYRRLCRELDIAVCSPEHAPGGIYSRAEWVLQGASDMCRIDVGYGANGVNTPAFPDRTPVALVEYTVSGNLGPGTFTA